MTADFLNMYEYLNNFFDVNKIYKISNLKNFVYSTVNINIPFEQIIFRYK